MGQQWAVLLLAVVFVVMAMWRTPHYFLLRVAITPGHGGASKSVRISPLPLTSAFNSKAPKFVVSLTTSPKRLSLLGPTLDSLLEQTYPAARILVNLPDRFGRNGQAYDLQDPIIAKYAGRVEFVNVRVDDGPATKLIPALRCFDSNEDVWIVTVDDDYTYLNTTLQAYGQAISSHPQSVRAYSITATDLHVDSGFFKMVPSYKHFRSVDLVQGFGGVAYHRSMFDESWWGYWALARTNVDTFLSDDLAISNFLALRNVTRQVVTFPYCFRGKMMQQNKVKKASIGLIDPDALHKQLPMPRRYFRAAVFLAKGGMWGLPHNVTS